MKKLALPELGIDKRVDSAANRILEEGLAEIFEPDSHEHDEKMLLHVQAALPNEDPNKALQDPLIRSLAYLATGIVDLVVVGAATKTAEVIKKGKAIVGLDDSKLITSYFKLVMPDKSINYYADCAVIPQPSPEQLAEIAKRTAKIAKSQGFEPRVAILSFSTHGSSSHPSTNTPRRAAEILSNDPAVDFVYDGEVQFDVATNPLTAQEKCPESPFSKESANVFIFPDLNSGNIGYKISQSFGATAIGPVLSGFSRPIYDLSRGCKDSDIVDLVRLVVS